MQEVMQTIRGLDVESAEIIASMRAAMADPATTRSQLADLYTLAHRYASILERGIEKLEGGDAEDSDIEFAEEVCERFGDLSVELAAMLRSRQ